MKKAHFAGTFILLFGSSCSNKPTTPECFYLLTVSEDVYAEMGPDALGRVFSKRFAEYQDRPTFSPPLLKRNRMHFADRCDLLSSENYIVKEFSSVGYSFELAPVSYDDYLIAFEDAKLSDQPTD